MTWSPRVPCSPGLLTGDSRPGGRVCGLTMTNQDVEPGITSSQSTAIGCGSALRLNHSACADSWGLGLQLRGGSDQKGNVGAPPPYQKGAGALRTCFFPRCPKFCPATPHICVRVWDAAMQRPRGRAEPGSWGVGRVDRLVGRTCVAGAHVQRRRQDFGAGA